jgi:hypothetical protein
MPKRTYPKRVERPRRTPPVAPLRCLRIAAGLKLDDVCESVTEHLRLDKPFTRGALSAIETGLRGASPEVLDALAHAYGLEPGDIYYETAEAVA